MDHKAVAAAFAAAGIRLAGIKVKPRVRRYVCAACGKRIPPGKAGRKCRECRQAEKGSE